jgi:hypothetical protein
MMIQLDDHSAAYQSADCSSRSRQLLYLAAAAILRPSQAILQILIRKQASAGSRKSRAKKAAVINFTVTPRG